MFVALAFDLCWRCWFIIFVVKSFEIILESLYSLSALSEKIGMPSPTNLGEKGSSFLSMFEQLMPPNIAGIKNFIQLFQLVADVRTSLRK